MQGAAQLLTTRHVENIIMEYSPGVCVCVCVCARTRGLVCVSDRPTLYVYLRLCVCVCVCPYVWQVFPSVTTDTRRSRPQSPC